MQAIHGPNRDGVEAVQFGGDRYVEFHPSKYTNGDVFIVSPSDDSTPLPKGEWEHDTGLGASNPTVAKVDWYTRTARSAGKLKGEYAPVRLPPAEELRGKRVLDVCCGVGRLVSDYRDQNVEIDGLDIHLGPEQRGEPHFRLAEVGDTGYPDSTFDQIYCSYGALTVFPDNTAPETNLRSSIGELYRILKPGGLLLATPTNREMVGPIAEETIGALVEFTPRHSQLSSHDAYVMSLHKPRRRLSTHPNRPALRLKTGG